MDWEATYGLNDPGNGFDADGLSNFAHGALR
jgi:hypothetical protein